MHVRWLYGSIPDWDHIFQEAFRVCRPGGWFESIEPSVHIESDDGSVPDKSAMAEWGRFYVEGGKMLGRTFEVIEADIQAVGIRAAGFQDVHVHDMKVSRVVLFCFVGGFFFLVRKHVSAAMGNLRS